MAQNTQKSSQRPKSSSRASSASKRAGSSGNGSAPKTRSRASSSGRGSSSAAKRSSTRAGSSKGPVASARDTVSEGAQSAGQAVGTVASTAKVPALAGGAALAGLAGGMAIAARRGRRRVLGVPVPGTRAPLLKIKAGRNASAKQLLKAGGQVAELANEVRMARQQLESRRRSPIEVVLDGLTARRGRDLTK